MSILYFFIITFIALLFYEVNFLIYLILYYIIYSSTRISAEKKEEENANETSSDLDKNSLQNKVRIYFVAFN